MSVPMMNIAATTGSRPLPVRIVRPDENSSFLPSPAIAQASTGELDLGRFTGDAIATIGPWPLIAEGQYAWLDIEGLSLSGDPRIVPIIQAHAVSSADLRNGLEAEVRRADLLAFRDGSTITVRCSVTFDQSFTKADGVAFPTATYRIRQVPAFGIDPSAMLLKVGESTQRTAFGGQLPYAYASSAPTVSRVDAAGTVTATGEGSALITASDGAGQKASFDVRVTSTTVYEDFENAPIGQIDNLNLSSCSIHPRVGPVSIASGGPQPMSGKHLYLPSATYASSAIIRPKVAFTSISFDYVATDTGQPGTIWLDGPSRYWDLRGSGRFSSGKVAAFSLIQLDALSSGTLRIDNIAFDG